MVRNTKEIVDCILSTITFIFGKKKKKSMDLVNKVLKKNYKYKDH